MTKEKKINYGKTNLVDELKAGKKAKTRITTMIDHDVYKVLRKNADDSGKGYQTLLNEILRKELLGQNRDLIRRLDNPEYLHYLTFLDQVILSESNKTPAVFVSAMEDNLSFNLFKGIINVISENFGDMLSKKDKFKRKKA